MGEQAFWTAAKLQVQQSQEHGDSEESHINERADAWRLVAFCMQ